MKRNALELSSTQTSDFQSPSNNNTSSDEEFRTISSFLFKQLHRYLVMTESMFKNHADPWLNELINIRDPNHDPVFAKSGTEKGVFQLIDLVFTMSPLCNKVYCFMCRVFYQS